MTETVRVLHVEDDPLQHRLLQLRLRSITDLRFDTTWVTREDEALAAFEPGRFDLVILDYMLAQGNGLHLLREFRARDRVVPIVALSGVATAAVAAELIREGADDYFDKSDPQPERFVMSLRTCLTRTARLRTRAGANTLSTAIADLATEFANRLGPAFYAKLDRLVADLGSQCRSLPELEALLARAVPAPAPGYPTPARPILLEVAARLFGDRPAES